MAAEARRLYEKPRLVMVTYTVSKFTHYTLPELFERRLICELRHSLCIQSQGLQAPTHLRARNIHARKCCTGASLSKRFKRYHIPFPRTHAQCMYASTEHAHTNTYTFLRIIHTHTLSNVYSSSDLFTTRNSWGFVQTFLYVQ